ncbi:MAG: hypothetical protein ACUVSQ_12235 [Pseudanabaenaceae cyanobacterium]
MIPFAVLWALLGGQPAAVASMPALIQAQTTTLARWHQRQEQARWLQPEFFDRQRYPLDQTAHWQRVLWAVAVREPQEPWLVEAIAALLPESSSPETAAPWLAVASQYRTHRPVAARLQEIAQNTPDRRWQAQVQRLLVPELPSPLPPLTDLLNWAIAPQPHLYVFCRPNRDVLCTTVLKDRQGQWVREGGAFWSVPLLLQSVHRLPWDFANGQTPQGLYRMEGLIPDPTHPQANPVPTPAEFLAYGQYPLIPLFFPTEKGQREFAPGQKGPFTGSLSEYQALWPPSWQSYPPITQSYEAGERGRTLLRIHGSGLATNHFGGWRGPRGWQPTLGCLAARETYEDSPQHDMPRLLQALASDRFTGYVVVIDVPGPDTPVAIADLPLGSQAETISPNKS